MDTQRFDFLVATYWRRRQHRRRQVLTAAALGLLGAGQALAESPATLARSRATSKDTQRRRQCKRDRRTPCDGRNWCIDRTAVCGPANRFGKCLVGAFGGNMCARIMFQVNDCDDCTEDGYQCALAAGGGDRCNNGTDGTDFICVQKI